MGGPLIKYVWCPYKKRRHRDKRDTQGRTAEVSTLVDPGEFEGDGVGILGKNYLIRNIKRH